MQIELKIGDKVQFSEFGKEELLVHSEDHYDEFKQCIGIVEKIEIDLIPLDTTYTEITVRWLPSNLIYIYPKEYLKIMQLR